MIVVSDTSPILSLAAVNRLQLLRELYGEIVVPTAVQYEFLRKGYRIEESWMHVVSARDHAGLAALLFQLDAGEAEAIVVAT